MLHSTTERHDVLPVTPVLSVNEAARVLGVERSTLYRIIRRGELQAVRVGRRRKFRPEDLDAYLERNRESVSAI
jgi:excisionase family DNA binding protein